VSCTKRVEEAVKRRDYIDYGETDYGVHALVPEARVFDKVLGWREVYTVWARLELSPVDGGDPVVAPGADLLSQAIARYMCGPRDSTYKYKCESSTPCDTTYCSIPSGSTVGTSSIDFSLCGATDRCAPTFVVTSASQSTTISTSNVAAYAPPLDPNTVSSCRFDASKEMSDLLYLCRYDYPDTVNKRYITTFSTWDRRSANYSFTAAVIGGYNSVISGYYVHFYYPFNTTYTKGSTDIYRYLYDVAVSYQ